MTDALPLPRTAASDAVRAAAEAKVKQREDAAFARGCKQGRHDERKDILLRAGTQTIDDLSMLAAVREEHKRAILDMRAQRDSEETKHATGNRWRGRVEGLIVGGALVMAGASTFIGVVFNEAVQYGREMTITGALSQNLNEPTPCVPGQPLPDGRVCPTPLRDVVATDEQ